jgi:CRISPR-associated protein Csd1
MSMLASLVQRYERLAARDEAPLLGYSNEKIAYGIVIDRDGNVIDTVPLGTFEKGKHRLEIMSVPQPVIRTAGIAANLLWDKTSYAFGVADPAKPSKRAEKKGLRTGEEEFLAFKKRQQEAIGETTDSGLLAFLAFLGRWTPESYEALPHAQDMLDANVVFRLDGETMWLHDRPAARAVVARASSNEHTSRGLCLVSGEDAPIARLHPSIKGVRDAQSSGAAIVSFNQSAFTSYGKDQGANAPVSEFAAFAYTTALNGLLADSHHRVQIGDASVVFWAEPKAGEEQAAEDATSLMAQFFGGGAAETPDSDSVEDDLLHKLASIAKGRLVPGLTVDPNMRFFVLGLSPNAARISVRFWLESSLGELAKRVIQHYEALRIEPVRWKRPPTFWHLLVELAAQRKTENIPAHLAGEFVRAVLSGGRYPLPLLTLAIVRLRADREVNDYRVALIKACLIRFGKEVPVSIDFKERNAGYRLGRLFGILERLQAAGIGRRNATIRDKFYASASATPQRIFPSLLRNAKNHSKSVRSKVGVGLAEWFEDRIAEALSASSSAFPKILSLEDQGRFAIGYYHQREAFIGKTAAAPVELDTAEEQDIEE